MFGSVQVYALYIVTDAEAGPPVGLLPAGAAGAAGAALAAPPLAGTAIAVPNSATVVDNICGGD